MVLFWQENGLSMAKIKVGSAEHTLPVFPLPGQALGTVGVALGYGRGANGEKIGKAAYQTKEYGGYVMKDGKHSDHHVMIWHSDEGDNEMIFSAPGIHAVPHAPKVMIH